ncbi:hypothetical protein [Nocardia grenadensis]|uniref:hypothetical protein n=1 Tax=Nocardia grenadensis TaxID=931537 RepID=UPI003D70B43C
MTDTEAAWDERDRLEDARAQLKELEDGRNWVLRMGWSGFGAVTIGVPLASMVSDGFAILVVFGILAAGLGFLLYGIQFDDVSEQRSKVRFYESRYNRAIRKGL